MDLFFSSLPILLLIYLMTKKNSLPSYQALPSVAVVTYLIALIWFNHDSNMVNAAALAGMIKALTPVMIIGGAILLFRTMEHSGAMKTIREWLNHITTNRVAQLMLLGWSFQFLIEGASGFGTPAALAAPILVGMGFPAVEVAIFALIMNAPAVSFGAVGTPTWYGFSQIGGLGIEELSSIGLKTSLLHGAAALIIPLIALRVMVDWKTLKRNILFIYISILSSILPYIAVSAFNYEFPSLLGGFIGLLVTVTAASRGWGLEKDDVPKGDRPHGKTLTKALFPLWGTLLLLIITRLPQLGIKALLNLENPQLSLPLGSLGILTISPSGILGLRDIFGTSTGESLKLLYIPSIIPFLLVSLITFLLYRSPADKIKLAFKETGFQLKKPFIALLGALIFVNLLMMGGDRAPTMIIGRALSQGLGVTWRFFAAYLGALGTFVAGSNTISNLTFGGIQDSIALAQNLDRTTILAMQSVGGAMGNMVNLNSIVAVCTVLGLHHVEGRVLKKTLLPMGIYGLVVGALALLL